jgi:NitT/TauT family transport system permease protein
LGIGPSSVSLHEAIAASLLRVFAGLLAAFGFALSFGLVLARFKSMRAAFVPLLQLVAPIAPIAWVPLAIAVFKGGNAAAVFIVWTGIGATMTLATLARLQRVGKEYLSVAATLGATGSKLWRFVYLPAVLPEVYFLLRLNFFGAWTSVLAAEMVGLNTGLGAIILMGRESGNGELILIGMVLIGIVGFTIDVLLEELGRALFPWQETDV